MKKIIAIVFLFVTSVYSQTDLDSLIDVGNKYYNEGQKEKALRVWEDIISKANDSTATFGTTMQNIQWYYIEANNEKKLLEAYEKIKKSKVKDKALNNQIGKPFKNYRYYSTTNLATFFAKNKRYQKALKYANIADNDLVFYTTSLTSYIFQK
ncbi:hypothetical protein BWK58_10315 [Flavobacterium columnare]|nr:hypothetical protein BWK58_10315 [Flavobacterium columnare]